MEAARQAALVSTCLALLLGMAGTLKAQTAAQIAGTVKEPAERSLRQAGVRIGSVSPNVFQDQRYKHYGPCAFGCLPWWSTDGTKIYFLNRDRFSKFISLNVADPVSGKVREILRETSDTCIAPSPSLARPSDPVLRNVQIQDAPVVFVGYGVSAPERDWDDYKGVDLHGKVAVFLINDPDFAPGRNGWRHLNSRRASHQPCFENRKSYRASRQRSCMGQPEVPHETEPGLIDQGGRDEAGEFKGQVPISVVLV